MFKITKKRFMRKKIDKKNITLPKNVMNFEKISK